MIGMALEITSWGVLQLASKLLLINFQQLPINLAVIDVGEPRIVLMAGFFNSRSVLIALEPQL
jgi:hypothetical protein